MATVSSLIFEVSLDSSKLKSGIQSSKTQIAEYARTATKALAGIAAAGAAGYAAMVTNTLNTAHEIKNLSQVANASVTDFQRYAHAFSTVGIETDKTADIFKDMSDRIGDFLHTGGGPLVDFFENIAPKVGVTAQQFKNLSGPDALQLYVSSLEKANLNQNEMAFYMEAIASDSTALLPLLKNNGAAVKDLGDQAERTGKLMTELDIKNAETIRAKVTELGAAFTGVKNEIVLGSLPAINELIDTLSNQETLENMKAMGTAIATSLNTAFEVANSVVGAIRNLAQEVAVFMNGIGAFDTERLQREINMAKNYLENGAGWDTKVDLLFMSDDDIRAEIARMESQVASNIEAAKRRVTQQVQQTSTTQTQTQTPVQSDPNALSPTDVRELASITQQFETPLERLNRKLGDAKTFLEKYGDQNETYGRMVQAAHDEYKSATEKNIAAVDKLTSAVQASAGAKTGNLNFDQSITGLRRSLLQGDEKLINQFKGAAERQLSGAIKGGTTDIDTLEKMRSLIDGLTTRTGLPSINSVAGDTATNALFVETKTIMDTVNTAVVDNTKTLGMLNGFLDTASSAITNLTSFLSAGAEPIGSIDFNLTMDGGAMSTRLQGTPKHLKFLRDFIAKNTNQAARQNAN